VRNSRGVLFFGITVTIVLASVGFGFGVARLGLPAEPTASASTCVAVSAANSTPAPASHPFSSANVTPPVSETRLRFGLADVGGSDSTSALAAAADVAGESPSIVLSYEDFNQPPPMAAIERNAQHGAISIVTWEPWTWGGGVNQPAYRSMKIISGAYDKYLTSWGTELAAWGQPVMIRYGQEMNADWYPWSDDANGNHRGDYAAAFRHVRAVVRAAGATNVLWVWSPNVPNSSMEPMGDAYPGSKYVDYVALDGYNWGTVGEPSEWVEPAALFAPGIAKLRQIAPGKPILIAETGSAEAGGSKAAWNTELIAYLEAQPDVSGFVMFDQDKERDWRIDSSPSSAAAFKSALARRRACP
jgi:beta-mannanase